jgi:hypothetical protein
MAKNRVQFQKGPSLPDFSSDHGSAAQCAETLFKWRWPQGFVCPQCGHPEGCSTIQTRGLLQCKDCRHQTSPPWSRAWAMPPHKRRPCSTQPAAQVG